MTLHPHTIDLRYILNTELQDEEIIQAQVVIPNQPYVPQDSSNTVEIDENIRWGEEGASTTMMVGQKIAQLERVFTFGSSREDIAAFLLPYISLTPWLCRIGAQIPRYFQGASPVLKVDLSAKDARFFEAIVVVNPIQSYGDASDILERFDNEWWIDAMDGTDGHITVTLQ